MGVYALSGVRFRKAVFLLGTVVLCLWVSTWGIIPMAVCAVVSYFCGRLIHRFADKKGLKRLWLILSVVANMAVLLVFIRSGHSSYDVTSIFTGKGAMLKLFPVWGAGIFTLHGISYCMDIYRKEIEPEKNFILVSQYICFFPCFGCGPILRFSAMSEQLRKPVITSGKLAEGIKLMLIGFAEKLFLSDPMYEMWQHIRGVSADSLSAACAWLGIIVFSFAFYYELRAYSHIAQGIGSMLGFELPDNFDLPFMSAGFNELIKRFACTFYSWVRDYFYRPICRNKDSVCLWALILSACRLGLVWLRQTHNAVGSVYLCYAWHRISLEKYSCGCADRGKMCSDECSVSYRSAVSCDRQPAFSLRICCRNVRRGKLCRRCSCIVCDKNRSCDVSYLRLFCNRYWQISQTQDNAAQY